MSVSGWGVLIGVMCRKLINRPGLVGARLRAKLVCEPLPGTALWSEGFVWRIYLSSPWVFIGHSVTRLSMYPVRTLMMSLAVAVLMQPPQASTQERPDLARALTP